MAKTTAGSVWHQGIKDSGRHGFDFIARCSDQNAALQRNHGMMLANVDGELTKATGMGAADHVDYGLSVAEEIADDDRYFLCHKDGGKIIENQKLASTYKIGDALYETATGTWTYAKSGTAASLLTRLGFLVGPADRITASTVKGIDDAFTATEPATILT